MKFVLVFILSLQYALACEMTFPQQMIVLGETGSSRDIVQSKNCTDQIISESLQTIMTIDGRISSSQLTEILASKGHENVQIQPYMMHVQQLKHIIREQLPLPTGIQVKETRGLNISNIVAMSPGDKVELYCPSCLYGTAQPINATISGFDGTKKSFVATADFKKMVKAYRLLAPFNAFSEINRPDLLKEEYVESIPHTDLITDLNTLKYYKTNKPLKTGELLRSSDLNALNLVKAGLKTDVILENQVVRIKTQGISRSNGTLGEFVEVFHPQKNKKYQGKVVDINKVLVEL